MSLKVLKAGLLDSLQDFGRIGHGSSGFRNCGVMDKYSFEILNILLGNDRGEAAIEISIMGGTYEFLSDNIFALSGAFCKAKLNDTKINTCKVYKANAGDILDIESIHGGMYCYLGVGGGFIADSIKGSKSTDLTLGIGGFNGRKLQTGDILEFVNATPNINNLKSRFVKNWLVDSNNIFNVILGPQIDSFSKQGIYTFFNNQYTITPRSNRMGLRLDGPRIEHNDKADIPSDGNAFGSIQVPSDGLPIILMADRGITGGYAKIGNIISDDLPKLAQCKLNSHISFNIIQIQEAQEKLRRQIDKINNLDRRINAKDRF